MKQTIPPYEKCQELNFEVVFCPKRAREIAAIVAESGKSHALDFETTGANPQEGEVRLTTIYGPAFQGVLDHWHCGSFASLSEDLADCEPWFVYYAKFEGRWFDHATEDPRVELYDVGLMDKAVIGGYGYSKLAYMVKRDLGISLPKDEQNSNWAADEITLDQYRYAYRDGRYTYELAVYWLNEMDDGQWRGFNVLNDAWRGTAEMEDCGMMLDIEYHKWLIAMWTRRRDTAIKVLRRWVGEDIISNLNSKKQIGTFIGSMLDDASYAAWPKTSKKEELKTDKKVLQQASFRSPYPFSRWLAALMVYNRASKYLSTYGEKLVTIQERAGRIRAKLNMAQAVTGRYSSSSPNLQNIPRSALVRRSFVAPKGATFVLADYSGIELRVLAEDAGDETLKHDVIFSNVHAQSAAQLYHMDFDEVMERLEAKDKVVKELRSKAKSFSFQLTYGAGYSALAVVLRCSDDEAQEYIKRWAARYSKAYNYRNTRFDEMQSNSGMLRLRSGRTIRVPKEDRTLPVASNYPIQGAAADVMYRAIYHCERMLWKAWKAKGVVARMCVTVHDELLLLTTPEWAEEAKEILEAAMKQGWLDIFPDTPTDNLVEAAIGGSWADKE